MRVLYPKHPNYFGCLSQKMKGIKMELITLTQNQFLLYELLVTVLSMAFGAFVHQVWLDRNIFKNEVKK